MKLLLIKSMVMLVTAAQIILGTPTVTVVAADLMVYPTRVVMTDRQRTAQVDIINSGAAQATYKIAMVRRRMTETGDFQEVTAAEKGEKFADDVVKFSPRQVTLLPGGGQTIRIMFKIPPELETGEYRSHLLFTRAASAVANVPKQEEEEAGVIRMNIVANVGISIPIIARHGQLQAGATIDPASVTLRQPGEKQQVLSFTMHRTGTRSIYGDVAAYRGQEKLAEGKGFAIYTPNTVRKVAIVVPEQSRLRSGDTVRLVFTERDEKKPLAETAVALP
ncbi:molecular chaperone [Geomonas anaerohicana]|uniref:Molecular chaperone n=1 Tax=Geomonas anaerohicana TaxID=2798583 RepID=A0ABS0Y975_9BACT|nr:molecular chaperone [Geomonas anaerohicana]MBJ6748842.1 molecular chaperone [Geomonas anaerohicana]